jgi:hypothetical protein
MALLLDFDANGNMILSQQEQNVMAEQLSQIECNYSLVFMLNNGQIPQFLEALKKSNQTAVLNAVEFCAKHGWIPELEAALDQLSIRSGLSLIQHLQVSSPTAIPSLLGHPAYISQINADDIQKSINNCSINPECLRAMVKVPRTRHLMYALNAPQQVPPMDGFGFSFIVSHRNAIKAAYAKVLDQEKQLQRAYYWRCLFWSGVVMRVRMQQFQERYYGPGGSGYQMAKASFDALLKSL